MKIVAIYGSTHGRTRKVVEKVAERLNVELSVFDVKDAPELGTISESDLLLFFAPTYGDEELQDDMEEFLRAFEMNLGGKLFAIAELGNYYGYDNFSFGAMAILRKRLLELRGIELCQPLSLDSLPRVNWGQLDRWVDHLTSKIETHDGTISHPTD